MSTDQLNDDCIESWNVQIKENQLKRIDEARIFYERLVDKYPLTGRFWKIYIEHEMKAKNYDKVEKLFQRSLTKVLHIDLWKCYLNYVKETKGQSTSFREKMAKAYDFALDKMGYDFMSYNIFNDYVTFIKNVDAAGSYAENQKITAVRKVYQRGVVNPMHQIETFWKDYVAYEQSVNQIIAEKMVADRSRDYMNARRVSKEYELKTRGLNKNAPTLPPAAILGNPDKARQVDLWRNYIAWEKSNPLRLEDAEQVIRRVEFAYEQCLLCLGHFPDVWYEYAVFLEECGRRSDSAECKKYLDDAAGVYERATGTLLKANILLHMAWADFEEGRNRKDKANKIYSDLLESPELEDPTLVYVQYLKFSRRAEGIKTARLIFKKARDDPRSSHHVYTAAALMEYYCSKDKNVACKIFELGLKKYPSESKYILSYIDFLSHLNEENNTRVLFERVLTSGQLPPESSLEIWNKFLEFESNIGDLTSITKVEKRRTAAVEKVSKSVSETAWLVDRYKFMDLYPCSTCELKAIGYDLKALPGSSSNVTTARGAGVAGGLEEEGLKSTAQAKPRPDLNQMLPFKPIKEAKFVHGFYRVNGGIFPPPPVIGNFLSLLPHPTSFRGPFVNVDELLSLIAQSGLIPAQVDSKPPKAEPVQNGTKYFETAIKASLGHGGGGGNNNSNNNHITNAVTSSPGQEQGHGHGGHGHGGHFRKRQFEQEMEDDQDVHGDNSNSGQGRAFDIYRSRQLQKRPK